MKSGTIGEVGEKVAANYLVAQGFEIIALNYFNEKGYCIGEIDIIARDPRNDQLVFVEVKTRRGQRDSVVPEESITKQKIERVQKAINWFLKKEDKIDASWRIDAISVIVDSQKRKMHIKHIKYIRF
ncbi:YraN family protein [bacterium]|jgi:putative endonuclease|nr:YraN family protein [bacterium]MBT4251465.1 YraN family protein [bacterium]MBT4597439.1 YraN family protein [bacterium]MBT6754278.1 YraN family protein [bacterium]MBT7037604.1 YraN family protein [bacterium]